MIIHPVPYEWVERYFGKFVADNFNTINLILGVIGLIIAIALGRKITLRIRNRQQSTFRIPDEYEEPEEPAAIYPAQRGEWSPTGWVYDRNTKQWEPPEYLSEESERKWRWDEEKRIWIDLEKEQRIERHKQWRKEQGKGPTFEEWKEQRMKEKAQEKLSD